MPKLCLNECLCAAVGVNLVCKLALQILLLLISDNYGAPHSNIEEIGAYFHISKVSQGKYSISD